MASLLLSVPSIRLSGLQVVLLLRLLLSSEHSEKSLLGGWLSLNFNVLGLLLAHLKATTSNMLEASISFTGIWGRAYQQRHSKSVMKKKIRIAVRIHRPTRWKKFSFLQTFCPCLSVVQVTLEIYEHQKFQLAYQI
jgi:hypothetical protein